MSTETIVMRDSDEAAQLKTVTGWVSRDGFFYGNDERIARYAGCTHDRCECGAVIPKSRIKCDDCRAKDVRARYENLERKEWDGVAPLALYDDDTYFFSEGDLEDYCDEHDCKVEDLMLVFCDPQYGRKLDIADYLCDQLPEDATEYDIPAPIVEAAEAFNKAVRDAGPLSWYPGKIRALVRVDV